jgi:hypothetical protein
MSDVPETPRRSWFGRNWIWVLPVGCLGPIVLCCGGPALIIHIVMGTLKSSDVYKEAIAKAQNSPAVIKALGQPVQPSYWVGGNFQVSNDSGNADLTTLLTGPNGTGSLHVVGTKNAGKWTYSTMEVQVLNNPAQGPIDLLQANNEPRGSLVPTYLYLEPSDLILQNVGAQTLTPAGAPAGSITQIVAASRITQLDLFARGGNSGNPPKN